MKRIRKTTVSFLILALFAACLPAVLAKEQPAAVWAKVVDIAAFIDLFPITSYNVNDNT